MEDDNRSRQPEHVLDTSRPPQAAESAMRPDEQSSAPRHRDTIPPERTRRRRSSSGSPLPVTDPEPGPSRPSTVRARRTRRRSRTRSCSPRSDRGRSESCPSLPSHSIDEVHSHSHTPSPLPPHTSTTTTPPPSVPMPARLRPLLRCPVCSPSLLVAPVTLVCGHTVCRRHLQDTHTDLLCPVSGCSSSGIPSFLPIIHPTSHVNFYPATTSPEDPSAHKFANIIANSSADVTVSKLLAVLSRPVSSSPVREHIHPHADDSEESDDDDDRQPNTPLRASVTLPPSSGSSRPQPTSSPHFRPAPSDTSDRFTSPSPLPPQQEIPHSPNVRPRKRRRRYSSISLPPLRRDRPADASQFDKELMGELTCEICFTLFYQPVTTPCQHTFCAKCLQRSLDHSSQCPLCRQDLSGFTYFQDHPLNKTVYSIILEAFPDAYRERGRILDEEAHIARLDTPIFVGQLAFPGMSVILHFFEPRYRLMLRRCLASPTPSFGMIMPPRNNTHTTGHDYGTMLEIRSVRMMPDGRSLIETWGTHRFRIMERGTLDGYVVGRVERIDDYQRELGDAEANVTGVLSSSASSSASGSGSQPTNTETLRLSVMPSARPSVPNNEALMDFCRLFVDQLQRGAAPWVVQRLNNTYGPMPTDPSNFSFWMALVLPIDEIEKSKLLPIKSPRLRLRLVVYWIEQLKSNWWFTSGCVIC